MSNVYVVKHVWWYEGSTDNFANCYEDNIERIFDSKDKAVAFIREKIKEKIENADEFDRDEFIEDVPPADKIIEGEQVEYQEYWHEHNAYIYNAYEVE